MRKINVLIIVLIAIQIILNAQSPPYQGGSGSGHSVSHSAFTQCSQFPGGDGDGADALFEATAPCSQFTGGDNDGTESSFSPITFCPQFPGGIGDGYSMDSSGCLIVLPVKLLSFYGEKDVQRNILHWKIESGYTVREFEIEKSQTGTLFGKAGSVSGSTNAAHLYTFVDNSPFPDISFYRLRITEKDFSISYSNIIALRRYSTNLLTVFPNPSRGISTIHYSATKPFTSSIQLFSQDGRQIANSGFSFKQGANYISLDLTRFSSGIYILKTGDQMVKIILQKIN